ncbi:sensor histidine kinase RegB [Marivita sp. XM-24bin2]|jgi:two-component system sensor histidine kinase RegB|uniref:sensor histidine kinase RegB n=1 Tax=unclassified Marivita TaxID=2632480 RepID=UPI000D7A7AB1|nr:ActS/PrrB/RegB family redox-sensitive histidine kinase [Marivita sp. XM-24bin2]MCR9110161.1 ActS/PrrB/RegB family redox-sensitive histidine kinase [Paracoccaceae bacterium]PWL34327.1 MAG: two-component sensor histidine kinase [Marivita sp. XM-24bin2]
MTQSEFGILQERQRGSFIRLRTMIWLRWCAIAGQLAAITLAQELYNLQLELGLCYLAVGVSIVGNLIAIFVFPENKRLNEAENFLMVLFDLLQLCFLIYLTGGLHNPFTILILGPVIVSATIMTLRSTIIIGATALTLVTLMVFFHLPLRTEQGFIMRIADVFVFGQWTAITIAVVFLSLYARQITEEMNSMSDAVVATQMALSRTQMLNNLGGVVAAAAHELGTPLATIKLTSAELIEDLDDQPELQDDARLIRDQADRCRDILQSMGRAGKEDLQIRSAPLAEVVREAAEPHLNRGKDVLIDAQSLDESDFDPPLTLRRPEVIHGLRNLIQNAVDFARSTVWIEARWSDTTISVRIMDDGPGYPTNMLGRIGDPFVRNRRTERDRKARPEYEGMGLGLFIAKTLLQRSGAELSFANGADRTSTGSSRHRGAVVEVVWPREVIVPPTLPKGEGIGENPAFGV